MNIKYHQEKEVNILLEAIGMGMLFFIVGSIPLALCLKDIEQSIEVKDDGKEDN